jgi:glycosyltransferase involved in cell wall biosynthesis
VSPPTVWVLVPDLSRTGVPTVLARLLSGVPRERASRIHVVARRGGPLRDAIGRSSASVTVLEPDSGRSAPNAVGAALRTLSGSRAGRTAAERVEVAAWKRRLRTLPAPDVVVVNGAGAWPLVAATPGETPVVLHLHELDTALDRCIEPESQRVALRRATSVMVVSDPVRELALRRGARSASIVTVPGVVADAASTPQGETHGRSWVMGAGTPGWRKGTDRVVALAWELGRRHPDVSVAWVGGRPRGVDADWVEAGSPLAWYEESPDPWVLLERAGVIVVPSREDPLPLVALEAGQHAKAVVATATGGLPSLLRDDRGVVVGHDLRALTDAVSTLLAAPARADELGTALADHVRQHHTVDVVAPTWLQVIDDSAAR